MAIQAKKSKLIITLVIMVESILLITWLIKEYYEFDYTCFLSQIQTRDSFGVSTIIVDDVPRPRMNRREIFKYPNMEIDVKMETLLGIDNVIEIKTKTTRNKYTLNQRKRRKKRPGSRGLPATTASIKPLTILGYEREETNIESTTEPAAIVTLNNCSDCNTNYTMSTSDMSPISLPKDKKDSFPIQLEYFAQNMICFGRTLLDSWSLLQILSTSLMLFGIWRNILYLLTPFLVLKVLFLVVSFIYGVTLTIFSLILFVLIKEMKWGTLVNWCCDMIFSMPQRKPILSDSGTFHVIEDI
uniref:Conserved plasma membrane protein n=1 Tax=Bursaphelenchus xylophilus TaxID=6326 RepID=A0A1I7RYC8_BURXY